MSNNTPDYKDDIVFLPPETTDRTQSTIEKLTEENKKLKQLIDFYWGELGEPEYRCTYKKDGCIGEKCDECKYFKVER